MKVYRINRLFNAKSQKCVDVAIDHGFFNEFEFLTGIEDMQSVIDNVIDGNPDAIQLTIGQLKYLQHTRGKQKPSLVLRTDVANVYGKSLPSAAFSKMIHAPVLQAIQADAACVCINLFNIPDAPEVTAQCISNILRIKPICDYYCMPLMIEPLIFRDNKEMGGYMVDGDLHKIISLVRQAVELGADIIKADPCDNIDDYHQVIKIAGDIPVLVRGGGKIAGRDIITRTKTLMNQGVSGIVYGRNIIQHNSPSRIIKVLMKIVHESTTVEDAIAELQS